MSKAPTFCRTSRRSFPDWCSAGFLAKWSVVSCCLHQPHFTLFLCFASSSAIFFLRLSQCLSSQKCHCCLQTNVIQTTTQLLLSSYKWNCMDCNRPFHGLWRHLGWGPNMAKITMNVWNFSPLGIAITPLQRGGFPTFATTLNSFIDIIHSREKKSF